MADPHVIISDNNGQGWYWEIRIMTPLEQLVLARGLSPTHAQARAESSRAADKIKPQEN